MVLVRGEEPAIGLSSQLYFPAPYEDMRLKTVRGSLIINNDTLLGKTSRQGEPFYSASSALDSLSGGALA